MLRDYNYLLGLVVFFLATSCASDESHDKNVPKFEPWSPLVECSFL